MRRETWELYGLIQSLDTKMNWDLTFTLFSFTSVPSLFPVGISWGVELST